MMYRPLSSLVLVLGSILAAEGCSQEAGEPAQTSGSAVTGTTWNGVPQSVGIQFVLHAGSQRYASSCSGALIGPKTVVTARHCFHQQLDNGTALTVDSIAVDSPYPSGRGETHGTGDMARVFDSGASGSDGVVVFGLTAAMGPGMGLPAAGPYVTIGRPACNDSVSGDGAMTNGTYFKNNETSRVESLKVLCDFGWDPKRDAEINTTSRGNGVNGSGPGGDTRATIESGDSGGLLYTGGGTPGSGFPRTVRALGVLSTSTDPSPGVWDNGKATYVALDAHRTFIASSYASIEGTAAPSF